MLARGFARLASPLQTRRDVINSETAQNRAGLIPALIQPKAIALALWLVLAANPGRTKAEDRVDYRFEDYQEEGGRIHIQTHGAYFDTELKPWLSVQGNFIYDSISGATPTGAPMLNGETSFAQTPFGTSSVGDIRRAGFLQAAIKTGNHTFSPQLSYSKESDYRSIGVSLGDAIDFNEKNTTLSVGISHSFDEVLPNEGESQWDGLNPATGNFGPITSPLHKETTDILAGLTQLLGPDDEVGAFLTLGYSSGYLNDAYKQVYFDGNGTDYFYADTGSGLNYYTVFPENRPDHKFRQVLFLSYKHYFEKLNAGAELTYRLHHDSYDVTSHTVSLQWNQKIGKIFILSPLVRFSTQTAASFYNTHFPGDPLDQGTMPIPKYFSADYRLSAMDTFTYGVNLSAKVQQHFSLDFAYKRYEMYGRDSITFKGQYPKANVFTIGGTVWF